MTHSNGGFCTGTGGGTGANGVTGAGAGVIGGGVAVWLEGAGDCLVSPRPLGLGLGFIWNATMLHGPDWLLSFERDAGTSFLTESGFHFGPFRLP
jgi:hypothetical protein